MRGENREKSISVPKKAIMFQMNSEKKEKAALRLHRWE